MHIASFLKISSPLILKSKRYWSFCIQLLPVGLCICILSGNKYKGCCQQRHRQCTQYGFHILIYSFHKISPLCFICRIFRICSTVSQIRLFYSIPQPSHQYKCFGVNLLFQEAPFSSLTLDVIAPSPETVPSCMPDSQSDN